MAQEKFSASDVEKRLQNGEQLASVLGVPESKIQAMAALGYNTYLQGKYKDAEVLFRGVTALDTKSYLGYAGMGAVALAKQPPDLEAAYTNLSRAAELNPNDATVQANLGETLLRAGKIEDAKTHLEKAFQLDPGHNDPGANRARAIVGGLSMIVNEIQRRLESQGKPVAKAS
jgi:tetratricopeptide (TPR) repeat protein